eukprot:CCRYP_011484-RA/>CCRYP_011484-RA protein AED:0.47 eAED:0.47 QI:0/-1/0/1/-1/0/1/0/7
MALASGG